MVILSKIKCICTVGAKLLFSSAQDGVSTMIWRLLCWSRRIQIIISKDKYLWLYLCIPVALFNAGVPWRWMEKFLKVINNEEARLFDSHLMLKVFRHLECTGTYKALECGLFWFTVNLNTLDLHALSDCYLK